MNFQAYSFVNISNIIENAVSSFRTEYYLSNSSTELIGGSWSTDIPPWSDGKYYWQRTVTIFTDTTKPPEISNPVCITGATGHDGKGVLSIIPEYAINQSKIEPPVSGWTDKPKEWTFGYYLWIRFKITYTDKTIEYTTPTCDSSWEIVNDIEIGGKNLLTESYSIKTFDTKKRNWNWSTWGDVKENSIDEQNDSIHIVTSTNNTDSYNGVVFVINDLEFVSGDYYTFSISIKGSYDPKKMFGCQVYYNSNQSELSTIFINTQFLYSKEHNRIGYEIDTNLDKQSSDGNYTILGETPDNNIEYNQKFTSWGNDHDNINDGINTLSFQRRFISFKIPDDFVNSPNSLKIVIFNDNMDILLQKPQLEKGMFATDWGRSEKDIQSQFDTVTTSISGVSSIVDTISAKITNKIWVSDITTSINKYDESTIKSIRDKISLQEQTIDGFQQTVKDMKTTIEKKADGTVVETLNNKYSELKQSVDGFKTTVESTYVTNDNLQQNYFTKSQTEQLANKIYWLVTDSSSSSSLTLTSKALEAMTNQFIVKSPDGKRIILEKGKITADALQSNNYVAPGYNSVYAQAGTYYNLSDGSITSKNFVVDRYGNVNLKGTVYATGGSFTGDIVANSLTLGSNVTIPESNVAGSSSYIKKDVTLGYVSQGYNGFQVSSNGLLKASNAIIYGTVYASSGSFSGTVYASSGSFTGTVNANAGVIGGCTISGNKLQVPSANITGQLTSSQIASNSITSDKIYSGAITTAKLSTDAIKSQNYSAPGYYDDGYAQQGSYLNLSNGSFTSKNLVIDNYGNLKLKGNVTATSGSFTGSVYADSGVIGGCSIQNGTLKVPAANITGNLSASQITVGYNNLQTQLNTMTNNISSATSTANSASSTASSALNKANSASTAASNAASTANTANSTANNALNKATDAAKTATNFVKLEYGGITVGNLTNYSLGNNVFIDSDSVDIRTGTTVLASFAANQIDLGKNNTNAVINLCGGVGTISAVNDQEHGLGIDIFSENTCVRCDGIIQVRGETSSGWRDVPTKTGLNCYSSGAVMYMSVDDPQYEHEASIQAVINYTDIFNGTYTISNHSYYHGNSSITLNTNSVNFSINNGAGSSNNFEISSQGTTTNHFIVSEQYMKASEGFTCGHTTDSFENNLLWSGTAFPLTDQTCYFNQSVSLQPHGIILVFRGWNNGAVNGDWNSFFISKYEVGRHNGRGHGFLMSSTKLNRMCQKYIYIEDTYLWGHEDNNKKGTGASGAKYENDRFVLQYVLGV